MTKQCWKCKSVKPVEEFYVFRGKPRGPCKPCVKLQAAEWARNNPGRRKSIVRESAGRRRELHNEKCREYSAQNKQRRAMSVRASAARYPEKRAARNELYRAILRGDVERKPCAKCATTDRVQGHHHDYSRPLDVVWLCSACHGKEHRRS